MSLRALAASVFDIGSVVRLNDRIAAPTPGNGSRGAVGEDLVITDQYGTKKLRRYISAMPINSETSEFESGVKRPRIEVFVYSLLMLMFLNMSVLIQHWIYIYCRLNMPFWKK